MIAHFSRKTKCHMTLQRLARYSLALLLLLFHHSVVHAQKRAVAGNVVNQDTREPLTGVTVSLKGTTKAVLTDSKGYFSITPPDGMTHITLTFSHIGFNSRQVKVDSSGVLYVTMAVN